MLLSMDVHLLKICFGAMTAAILIFGTLLNNFEDRLPVFIVQSYRFGKFAYKGKGAPIKPIEVPKRWFRHFYLFSFIFSLGCFVISLNVYIFYVSPSEALVKLLNIVATPSRSYSVSSIASLLALLLLTMQCARRFYETWFISVFSSSRMNLSHYLIGYFHYFGSVCAILAEAPGFTPHVGVTHLVLRLQILELRPLHLLSILSFLWAFYLQYLSAIRLANLRKNNSGEVVTQEHHLPCGGMFELVSSPHMLCEIVMYLSLTVLLWGNSIMPWISAWVVSNQVENALLTHWWYQTKFKEYPKQRKAILPFIL